MANLWNCNSKAWISAVRRGADRYRSTFHDPTFFELLGPVRGLDILDAGCGEGITSRVLANMGGVVTGVDISEELIASARLTNNGSGDVRYFVDSFLSLESQPAAGFDRVISIMALMDSPRIREAFLAFRRVLRQDGRLVFSVGHPMTDKMNVSWSAQSDQMCIRNYFENTPWEDVWSFSGVEQEFPPLRILNFPRTLEEYFNELSGAGFRLLEIREPKPTAESVAANPALKKWTIVPFYLMVAAQAM